MIYIFVCFFIFSPVAIAIDEPIKCAGRVFGIDRDWLQSQQIMSPLSVLYRVYNTVKLRAVVHLHVLLFWGEKFRYSLNENSPSKMYKGKNVLEILFTLKRDKKKKRKQDCVLLVVIDILIGRTHTHTNQFFFSSLPRLRCPSFFLSFSFYEVEKRLTSEMKKKNAQLATYFCYPFLVFFHRWRNLLPPFFLIVSYFSFPVCSWLEEDYRALYSILIHHHRLYSFVSFYPVLSETSDQQ